MSEKKQEPFIIIKKPIVVGIISVFVLVGLTVFFYPKEQVSAFFDIDAYKVKRCTGCFGFGEKFHYCYGIPYECKTSFLVVKEE